MRDIWFWIWIYLLVRRKQVPAANVFVIICQIYNWGIVTWRQWSRCLCFHSRLNKIVHGRIYNAIWICTVHSFLLDGIWMFLMWPGQALYWKGNYPIFGSNDPRHVAKAYASVINSHLMNKKLFQRSSGARRGSKKFVWSQMDVYFLFAGHSKSFADFQEDMQAVWMLCDCISTDHRWLQLQECWRQGHSQWQGVCNVLQSNLSEETSVWRFGHAFARVPLVALRVLILWQLEPFTETIWNTF